MLSIGIKPIESACWRVPCSCCWRFASANVAHLLLARATGRVHEIAVRSALGASGIAS